MGSAAAQAHLPFICCTDKNLHLSAALVRTTSAASDALSIRRNSARARAVISLSRALSFAKAAETASGAALLNKLKPRELRIDEPLAPPLGTWHCRPRHLLQPAHPRETAASRRRKADSHKRQVRT